MLCVKGDADGGCAHLPRPTEVRRASLSLPVAGDDGEICRLLLSSHEARILAGWLTGAADEADVDQANWEADGCPTD